MIFINGSDAIFYIKHDGEWLPISCEISTAINESSQMINTTTRDNKGWETSQATLQSYSIELECEIMESIGLSYWDIKLIKREGNRIEWKVDTSDGFYKEEGFANITSLSDSNSAGEFITFSMSLQGNEKFKQE